MPKVVLLKTRVWKQQAWYICETTQSKDLTKLYGNVSYGMAFPMLVLDAGIYHIYYCIF